MLPANLECAIRCVAGLYSAAVVSSYYPSRVSADLYCASHCQGLQTYSDGSKTIKEDSCASSVSNVIHAGPSRSVDAASCAARIIDEDSYELRTVISGRGLLRLVDQCGGLLRLDIANAANCASLIVSIDEDSCTSLSVDAVSYTHLTLPTTPYV